MDLQTDGDFCGTCGTDCPDGLATCIVGNCECVPGVEPCGFAGPCSDILSDPLSCGATCGDADGNECATDRYCSGGACECRPEYTEVAGDCIDTLTNPAQCGPIGGATVACDGATPQCEAGVCVAACSAGADCTEIGPVASGTCVDLDTHSRHCGACEDSCAADEICVAGVCQGYATTGDCASCPCDRCDEVFGGGGACCAHGTDPICVDAPSCP